MQRWGGSWKDTHLVVAQVFAAEGCFEAATDLFARDCLEIDGRQYTINDLSIVLLVLGGY